MAGAWHTDIGKRFTGKAFSRLFEDVGVGVSVGKRDFKDNKVGVCGILQ